MDVLTPFDSVCVEFYSQVQTQYINQSPMGSGDGTVILTPRIEGYESVLRTHGYAKEDWPELIKWASFLHGVVTGSIRLNLVELYRLPLEHFVDPEETCG